MSKTCFCGTILSKRQRKYCSVGCQAIGLSQQNAGQKTKKQCEFCKKDFVVPIYLTKRRFCSRKCKDTNQKYIPGRRLGQKQQPAEIEKRRASMIETFKRPDVKLRSIQNLYELELRLGYWPGSDEKTKLKRKETYFAKTGFKHPFSNPEVRQKCENSCLKRYGENSWQIGKNSQNKTDTTPELIVKKFLELESINFIHPCVINGYEFDFFLIDYELLIEVDGDYWHANPKLYSTLGKSQINSLLNDSKKNRLVKILGIQLLRIWESDVLDKKFYEIINEEISN